MSPDDRGIVEVEGDREPVLEQYQHLGGAFRVRVAVGDQKVPGSALAIE
jgi:hypothetical protein